ncbi:hypothetical protein [Mesorhizobium sp. M0185]|uniref:hypothetical protein n=1 Tax=Mesorhizobium sp. M0185 TaxID=2956907 RepID=UPI00333DB332
MSELAAESLNAQGVSSRLAIPVSGTAASFSRAGRQASGRFTQGYFKLKVEFAGNHARLKNFWEATRDFEILHRAIRMPFHRHLHDHCFGPSQRSLINRGVVAGNDAAILEIFHTGPARRL